MPYQVSWLVPNRIILTRYFGVFTSEDLKAYLDESLQMRDDAIATLGEDGALIHTLTDARKLERYTIGFADVQGMLKSLRQQRVGWSIFVHPGKMERFFSSIGHHWTGVRHREFATIEEAITFLKEDTSLPDFTYVADERDKQSAGE
ncbi:MAG: hypothetical protein H6672_11740 [Anaerolineaceae bacterium]|nr:hypothetical protein [Anaerolineaceae bacterium]